MAIQSVRCAKYNVLCHLLMKLAIIATLPDVFFYTKTGFGALWRLHRSSAICAISGTKLDNRYMAPYLNVPTSGWRHIFQDIVYGKYIRRLISMSFCMEHQETIMNRPKSENWPKPKLKPKFNLSRWSRSRNPCSLTFGRFSHSPSSLPPSLALLPLHFFAKWDEFRSFVDKMSSSSSQPEKALFGGSL